MNWIRDFVDLDGLDIDALIHRFTLSTAEVEEVFHYGRETSNVVIAQSHYTPVAGSETS